jgi:hypothetical protein
MEVLMLTKPPILDTTDPVAKAVYDYAKHGAMKQEVIELLQMNPKDFDQFQEVYDSGMNQFKHNIRKSQLAHAVGNANMAIWLGKQFLNQRDYKDDGEDTKKAIDAAVGSAIQELLKDNELVPIQKRITNKPELKKIK